MKIIYPKDSTQTSEMGSFYMLTMTSDMGLFLIGRWSVSFDLIG